MNASSMNGGHNMTDMNGMQNMSNVNGMHNMSNVNGMHNMSDNNMQGGHNDMTNMHGDHDSSGEHPTGHSTYFHTGVSEYILLEEILTHSSKDMIASCFVIFIVAVLYEGLKYVREILLEKSLKKAKKSLYAVKELNKDAKSWGTCDEIKEFMISKSHFLQVFLHMLQMIVSYCLMLVFMTFNIWLCLAVIVGAGAGYFLFGWKRAVVVDINEHCH